MKREYDVRKDQEPGKKSKLLPNTRTNPGVLKQPGRGRKTPCQAYNRKR